MDQVFEDIKNRKDYFMYGGMDHTPQEWIDKDKTYTSAFIFFTKDFHREFQKLRITLKKWSSHRPKSYRTNFIDNHLPRLLELPFFAHILTAKGSDIYFDKQRYIRELKLDAIIKTHEKDGRIYDIYNVNNKKGVCPFELQEKISVGALHISHFIIRSFMRFKDLCKQHGIFILDDAFQLFHDKLPGENEKMGGLISSLVSLSQYYGYPTRIISFQHWDSKNNETAEDLLADNLVGLFNHIALDKYDKEIVKLFGHDQIFWEV